MLTLYLPYIWRHPRVISKLPMRVRHLLFYAFHCRHHGHGHGHHHYALHPFGVDPGQDDERHAGRGPFGGRDDSDFFLTWAKHAAAVVAVVGGCLPMATLSRCCSQ